MRQRTVRPLPRPRKQRRSCLAQLLWLTTGLLILVMIFLVARLYIGTAIGRVVADRLAPTVPADAALLPGDAVGILPDLIAALPPGEVGLSAERANALLTERGRMLGPVEAQAVRFENGQASADLAAYGVDGTAHAQVSVVDGRIVVDDVRIDGALGMLIPSNEIAGAVTERINAELARQGRYVEAVRIEDGQVIVVTR